MPKIPHNCCYVRLWVIKIKIMKKASEIFGDCNIDYLINDVKKGNLSKIRNKWFVDYIVDSYENNDCHHRLLIYGLEKEIEEIADLKLVEKYNKPVSELEGLEIDFKCILTLGFMSLGNEYAILL